MRAFLFKAALNTSTLRPFQLDVPAQVRVCGEAGYEGIELWMKDIVSYREEGGDLADVRKLSEDLGIEIFDGIAFIRWADADPAVSSSEIEKAKKEMEMLAALGCRAVAAPPCGDTENITIAECAERFARLWAVGRAIGVEPYLEMWGHRGNIRTVRAATEVLRNCGVAGAKVLVDPIHIHKGGGSFQDLSILCPEEVGAVHVNDFPLSIARADLTDKDRCFPGEGESDLALFRDMILRTRYRSYLSLELFIEDYGGRTAEEVARHGLQCMQQVF